MKTKIFLLTIFNLINFSFAQTNTGWFWQYPKPQGSTLRDIYVFNKDTTIAVGDLGTVIKTTDGGAKWSVQHHAGGTSNTLFNIHFIDPMNGWAAGGILLKTTDGGESWTQVILDSNYSNAVYFVDKDTGFAVGTDGYISRTIDGGKTWNTKKMDDYIGIGWLDIFDLWAITFTDKQTGWIIGAGYYGNQIYKTTDCGRSWYWNEHIIMPKVLSGLIDICFLDKNNGFIVGDMGVFLKTNDGGDTWQYHNLSDQYNKENYQFFNSIIFTDSSVGWIVGGNGTIDSHYGGVILSTIDGGKNWIEIDSTQNYGQLYKIRFSNNNQGWIIGQSGIIYRTTNTGKNWISQREDNYNFNSIYFVDENTGWAVGDSGIILHTTNGDDWDKQYKNDSLIFNSLQAIDNNVIIVGNFNDMLPLVLRKAVILMTNDEGLTWELQTIDSISRLNSVYFTSSNIGWVAGNTDIYKTLDGGKTWVLKYRNNGSFFFKIQFVNEQTGWIIDRSNNQILKTTNSGESWNAYQIDTNLIRISFHFVNANMGWAVGDSYGGNNIFKTTDGGKSWSPCGGTFLGYSCTIYFVNETTGWITGYTNSNQKSIIKTTDGGGTWHGQDIPSNNLTDIFFLNENMGWVIGDGIFKTTNGGGIVSVKDEKENRIDIPKEIELFQNYPNPFNPSTMINYQLTINNEQLRYVKNI